MWIDESKIWYCLIFILKNSLETNPIKETWGQSGSNMSQKHQEKIDFGPKKGRKAWWDGIWFELFDFSLQMWIEM